jgi:sialate O-acetylesterase
MVQLANYKKADDQPTDHAWAHLREAQFGTTKVLDNTGMACIIDIGEANDIHPRNKKDVGYRLSRSALKIAYGKDIVFSGPIYKSIETKGSKAIINFEQVGSGLVVKNKYGYVNGFAVAGADKKFYYAKAEITDKNTITISSDKVTEIKAVRYAWAANPDDVNLYNSEDLPTTPFRTDNW